jgi:HlyD family secretion protein
MFMAFVLYQFFFATRSRLCKLSPIFSIDTVRHGKFAVDIPANGVLTFDSISKRAHVKMQIDQLYLSRVKTGLKATSTVNSREYFLTVTSIDTVLTHGRFETMLTFDGDVPQSLHQDAAMRLRLYLTSAIDATIIPVGGFYRDTGGRFVYVVEKDDRVVKRNAVLGRKNAEYFEVLNGLKPGEMVITSSYEWFDEKDTVNLSQIRELYK